MTPAKDPGGEVVFYRSPDGVVRLEVPLAQETVWLTQQQMAALFQRERSVITKHINNVFKEGELDLKATCAKFAQVQSEGGKPHSRPKREATARPSDKPGEAEIHGRARSPGSLARYRRRDGTGG
jgi:hypothetical protein